MLIEAKKFNDVEVFLRERGELDKFEKESGAILGRAMVTYGDVPEGMKDAILQGRDEERSMFLTAPLTFMIPI